MTSRSGESAISEEARRVLQGAGWELGPDFEQRYHADAWVFNLVNLIERLVGNFDQLKETMNKRNRQLADERDEWRGRFKDLERKHQPPTVADDPYLIG